MQSSSLLAAVVGILACAAGPALAEESKGVQIRNINTAQRKIGCSRYTAENCRGMVDYRTGLVVVDIQAKKLGKGRVSPIGWFHGDAEPRRDLLASQMLTGGGARVALGSSWVQGGLGIAAQQVARGPKTITTADAVQHADPAVMLGVGTNVTAFDTPVQLSLDVGSSIDQNLATDGRGRTYQLTANALVTSF